MHWARQVHCARSRWVTVVITTHLPIGLFRCDFVLRVQASVSVPLSGISEEVGHSSQGLSLEVYFKGVAAPIPPCPPATEDTPAGKPVSVSSNTKFGPLGKTVMFENLPDTEAIYVAWITEEEDHVNRIVSVWRVNALKYEYAIVYGPLPDNDKVNLKLKNNEYTSAKLRDSVNSR